MDLVFNLINLAIFIAIVYGTVIHHRRDLHVKVMIACFIADLLLLCAVEFLPDGSAVRRAVDAASGETENRTILLIHVAFSILTLLLWIFQIVCGRAVLKGRMELLPRHARGARYFLLARFGNLITAFFV